MYVEWDNLRVDRKCLDPRPPQMSVPDVYPEGIPFPDARPPQDRPDRLEDDTSLGSVIGGIIIQNGLLYPLDQEEEQPGSLSGQPLTETVAFPVPDTLGTQNGNILTTQSGEEIQITALTTPFGPNYLADDVTFLTGWIPAPDNN